jgi:hypothetical protein
LPPINVRAGGVKLVSGSRRITVDNTLDERLRLLEDRVLFILFAWQTYKSVVLDVARDQKRSLRNERESKILHLKTLIPTI